MASFAVSKVELRLFCHATEDLERVIAAARNLLPPNMREKLRLSRDVVSGHHGNVIIILGSELANELAVEFVNHLARKLPENDKRRILADFRSCADGSSLYLRLDKQEACKARLTLGEEDAIRVRIVFDLPRASLTAVEEACRSMNLIP